MSQSGLPGAAKPINGPRFEISYGAEGFPEALRAIPRPPEMLYCIGNLDALREGIAVVGARKATPYGRSAAKMFAGQAAQRGICVISGGARGCDAAAHEAALDAGGPTVVFLGGGCDEPYPACNRDLFQRVVDCGGVIASEYPWGQTPRGWGFRARNRLIAGLARATLIVEAGLPSGTFSTADEALSANKDVLVVPGSIFSPTSRGANALLSQGATPVVDEGGFALILDDLFPEASAASAAQQPLEGFASSMADAGYCSDPVLAAISADPLRLEQLTDLFVRGRVGQHGVVSNQAALFEDVGKLMGHVALLESQGVVARFPDGRFGVVSRSGHR